LAPKVEDVSEPASRQGAELHFSKMEFDQAMAVFQRLRQRLSPSPENEAARDFLAWRMALCAKGQGHTDQAITLLRPAASSRYPVVRALARYHLGTAAVQQQKYLEGASEAHQALAVADALEGCVPWIGGFKRDCRFLIAKAVTLEALSLREAPDQGLASEWSVPSSPDPWGQLDDESWLQVLQSGAQAFNEATLGPRIEAVKGPQGRDDRWKVICNGASLEEVLLRFSALAGVDVAWSCATAAGSSAVDSLARRRPLFIYLIGATPQEVLMQTAGVARLFVRMGPSGSVTLVDPFNYRSLGEHIADLRQEAMSLWVQFRLISDDQDVGPISHCALGLLYEHNDQPTEAISEYSLLANRFPRSSLAPQSLLRSSRLRTGLRDYAGARQDLGQLVEQYPEAGVPNQALLALAEVTVKVGMLDEAVRLYTRAFHSEGSLESRRTAALGACRCLYQQREYEQTLRWLTRYLDMPATTRDSEACEVDVLLGKTYLALGRFAAAAEVLERALEGPLERLNYMGALSALVQARIGGDDPVGALNALDREHPRSLTRKEHVDLSILKAQVLRSMGLVERAVGLLEQGLGSVTDPDQKVAMFFQLAQCHQDLGQWATARGYLSDILMVVEPGPLALQACLDLASVSLRLGQPDQAIALCRQVLGASPPDPIRQKASDLLAAAYVDHRDYDQAAKSLLPLPREKGQPGSTREGGPPASKEGVTRAEG